MVTALECFNDAGEQVVQFFGKRKAWAYQSWRPGERLVAEVERTCVACLRNRLCIHKSLVELTYLILGIGPTNLRYQDVRFSRTLGIVPMIWQTIFLSQANS